MVPDYQSLTAFLQLPQEPWYQTKDSTPEFEQKYLGRIAKASAIGRWKALWINGAQWPSGEKTHSLVVMRTCTHWWLVQRNGIKLELSSFITKITPSRLLSTLFITTVIKATAAYQKVLLNSSVQVTLKLRHI